MCGGAGGGAVVAPGHVKAVLRANRNKFDPILQFHDRAVTLAMNGACACVCLCVRVSEALPH